MSLAATTAIPAGGAHTAPPALIIDNLSKSFGGQKALDRAALTVAAGEVHGLLGQNGSGKSTLIKVLAGFHAPDPGARLEISGEPVHLPLSPGAFRRHRISFVHQHLGLIPTLTVVENMIIGRLAATPRWAISWRRERERTAATCERYGVHLDPAAELRRLSPVERALLAIVRAVDEMQNAPEGGHGSGVLVLDEPTPFLPKRDVDRLFSVVRNIVAEGASVIFVSHDVDEVVEITDRATILRDGKVAGTLTTAQSSKEEFIEKIVGRKFVAYGKDAAVTGSKAAHLLVTGLGGGTVRDFSLEARAGEIVGLTGLVGSGYAEVPYLLYGARAADAGMLAHDGREVPLPEQTPADAIASGIVLIPGDRHNAGAIATLPIVDNMTMPVLATVFRGWALARHRMVAYARDLGRRFEVLPERPLLPMSALSGGNQQKVLLAKWLQQAPSLVLLDEPTQGIDIGARQAVFRQIADAAAAGAVVLCASSDYEQLEAIADRVLVFAGGKVVAELTGNAITKAAIAERCYGSVAEVAALEETPQ